MFAVLFLRMMFEELGIILRKGTKREETESPQNKVNNEKNRVHSRIYCDIGIHIPRSSSDSRERKRHQRILPTIVSHVAISAARTGSLSSQHAHSHAREVHLWIIIVLSRRSMQRLHVHELHPSGWHPNRQDRPYQCIKPLGRVHFRHIGNRLGGHDGGCHNRRANHGRRSENPVRPRFSLPRRKPSH